MMDESSIVTRDIIDNDEFEYVPDFVKLAEAYGAKAMRITKVEDIEKGFQLADTFKRWSNPTRVYHSNRTQCFANGTSGQVFKRYVIKG